MSTPSVKHLTIVEEAALLVPDFFRRRTTSDLTATEDMVLAARAFGEGLILIAQRPTISSHVLANAGTKVVFRTPYDTKKAGELLALSEEEQESLKTLRKYEAMIKTARGGPYRVRDMVPLQQSSVLPAPSPQQLGHHRQQRPTPNPAPSSLESSVAVAPLTFPAREVDNVNVIGSQGCRMSCTNREANSGSVVVDWWDVERLLSKTGSDMFRLFRVLGVAHDSNASSASEIAKQAFGAEQWRFADAQRVLTNTRLWMMPLIVTDNNTLTLTTYGKKVWEAVQRRRRERVGEKRIR
jgi:hypothetical protein